MKAQLIKGGFYKDERGQIDYINDFDVSPVSRFYAITHQTTAQVRAWQAHRVESKWFCCVQGRFEVRLVKIDNWENPSDALPVEIFTLDAADPAVLSVPPGYANGLQALENNSKILVFSDFGLQHSLEEKIRFDKNKWTTWR